MKTSCLNYSGGYTQHAPVNIHRPERLTVVNVTALHLSYVTYDKKVDQHLYSTFKIKCIG